MSSPLIPHSPFLSASKQVAGDVPDVPLLRTEDEKKRNVVFSKLMLNIIKKLEVKFLINIPFFTSELLDVF